MSDRADDYGAKIIRAWDALVQLHADTSKLLRELEGRIARKEDSLFPAVYGDQSPGRAIESPHWMVPSVSRYWGKDKTKKTGVIDGVTVCFGDDGGRLKEPILIVGRMVCKTKCGYGTLRDAYFALDEPRPLGRVVTREGLLKGKIEKVRLMAKTVYSINDRAEVEEMMKQVRSVEAATPAVEGGQP